MPRISPAVAIEKYMSKLLAQRQHLLDTIAGHQAELAKIEGLFSKLGVSVEAAAGRGKRGAGRKGKAAAKVAKRRRGKRRKFDMTADETVLAFVKKHGQPSTKEVNAHWQKEGRGGKADNTLTRLVQAGQLKRVAAKDVRGSRYTLV